MEANGTSNRPVFVVGAVEMNPDEGCFGYAEVELMAPDSKGLRRYQRFLLERGGKLAEFRIDLGPAKDFTHMPFSVLSSAQVGSRVEAMHTVGECIEMAQDAERENLPKAIPSPHILEHYADTLDQAKRLLKGIKTFGPWRQRQ